MELKRLKNVGVPTSGKFCSTGKSHVENTLTSSILPRSRIENGHFTKMSPTQQKMPEPEIRADVEAQEIVTDALGSPASALR
jgi:hypothetical protein